MQLIWEEKDLIEINIKHELEPGNIGYENYSLNVKYNKLIISYSRCFLVGLNSFLTHDRHAKNKN